MTVSSTVRRAGPFVGNDSASAFPFAFKVFSAADVYVVRLNTTTGVEQVLALTADYTVSVNADQHANPGGTVTLTGGALATGYALTITSNILPLQQTDLTNQGGFYPSVINNALDKLTVLIQQALERLDRALSVPLSSDTGLDTELPPPIANHFLAWNDAADGLQSLNVQGLATIVAFGTAHADIFDGDGVTTQFALTSSPGSLNNLDVSIGGVTKTPGIDYSWTSGTTITFTAAPAAGTDNVLVRYLQGLPQLGAQAAPYTPAGAGAVETTLQTKLYESISVKDFGAVGDGVADDTVAMQNAITYANTGKGKVYFPQGKYLYGTTLTLTEHSSGILGAGGGNCVNSSPSTDAPTTLVYSGAGPAIRVKGMNCRLEDFRLTSDTARAALSFDISRPGIRIEADDTSTGRADRCHVHSVRVDKQPGDGILTVGPVTASQITDCDVISCKGFGIRLDAGNYTGLTRTYPSYPGLIAINDCRTYFCGGHGVAVSNPLTVTQANMGIRININQLDSFGNGDNTAIMYAAGDGNFYDTWIFGEQINLNCCGLAGTQGSAMTVEQLGGLYVAGRDISVNNCRFIETKQPIYWGYVSAQPSTGLEVNQFRLHNSTLTHTDMVKLQSASAVGLRVAYDRRDFLTNVATKHFTNVPTDVQATYRGAIEHVNAITGTGTLVTLADDTVYAIPITGAAVSTPQQGLLVIAPTAASAGGGLFHLRLASTSPVATKWAGETNTTAHGAGGALTGTTGTDGNLNVSCSNSAVYIENRRGFSIVFTYQILAMGHGVALGAAA